MLSRRSAVGARPTGESAGSSATGRALIGWDQKRAAAICRGTGLAPLPGVLTPRNTVSRTVFIVERDPANLEVLARTFRERGWQAFPMGGCVQAMMVASAQTPELLVIDQRLAHDGGVSL